MDCKLDQIKYTDTVIKPPSDKRTEINQVIIMIDSRDRNYTKYPNSNKYTIMLNESYRNVESVELIAAHIPNSGYLINNNNNKLEFSNTVGKVTGFHDDGKAIREKPALVYTVNIPNGNYSLFTANGAVTKDQLAETTLANINTTEPTGTYEVLYNIISNKYTIKKSTVGATDCFYLLFNDGLETYNSNGEKQYKKKSNTVGSVLGYNRNYTSTITGTVATSSGSKIITGTGTSFKTELQHLTNGDKISIVNTDLNAAVSIETLTIDNIESNTKINTVENAGTTREKCELIPAKHSGNMTPNLEGDDYILLFLKEFEKYEGISTSIQNAFAKLHLKKGTNQIDIGRLKTFNAIAENSIAKLDRLIIEFRDYNNNLYDFNNSEHSLVFAVNYQVQSDKYYY